MPDKTPRNSNKEPHGYWKIHFDNGGHYTCYFINEIEFGLSDAIWSNGFIEKTYNAR